ncbi:MAG: WecB/TagA/CpsF family glycosyltransferase [Eubacteriales bacterium]|nr:WecB/TagA/CpsF family glycosyltransferase [Eubacteriales bacterium]MDD4474993.1 WecB/TagA/CpsF family glycosyltransferase [Eubacteriales bacterium]
MIYIIQCGKITNNYECDWVRFLTYDMKKKYNLFGIKIDGVNLDEAVAKSLAIIDSGQLCSVFTPNAYILLECLKNKNIRDVINTSDLCIPDGEGVLRAAKLSQTPITEKVAGVDYAYALMKALGKREGRLFIYGGTSENLNLAIKNATNMFPQLICDGINGYDFSEEEAINAINKFGPDAVFVCLGSPKQEYFIYNNKNRFHKGIFAALGGTVDIISGTVKRAPKLLIKYKLEWFWRAFTEPKRFLKLPKLLELEYRMRRLKSSKSKEED